jgi:ABC-type microcin C transport system permease subunit YejE
MFILESKESKVAAVGAGVLLVVGAIFQQIISSPAALDLTVRILALLLGVAMGWILGEAFTYLSGVWKVITGAISAIFSGSVTLDAIRKSVQNSSEKVFYFLSLIPVTNPRIVDAIVWFSLGFTVFFVIAMGIIYTRRKEQH